MEYNKREYRNIRADVILHPDNNFDIYAVSANDGLNLELEGNGSIHPDDYVFASPPPVSGILTFGNWVCHPR